MLRVRCCDVFALARDSHAEKCSKCSHRAVACPLCPRTWAAIFCNNPRPKYGRHNRERPQHGPIRTSTTCSNEKIRIENTPACGVRDPNSDENIRVDELPESRVTDIASCAYDEQRALSCGSVVAASSTMPLPRGPHHLRSRGRRTEPEALK